MLVVARLALAALLLAVVAPAAVAGDMTSPLTLSPSALPPLTSGAPFTVTFTSAGGKAPYVWSAPFLPLPVGLTLNPASGLLTGTPTVPGTSVIFVRATDANGLTIQRGWNVPIGYGSGSGGTVSTPPPPHPPATFTVTVTNGSANGSATLAAAPGVTVTVAAAAAPTGQWFQQWNGNAPLANSLAATTTFTMPSANITLTASFFTPAPVTQPVTGHPRLWINTTDLTALRARAVTSSSVYNSLVTLLGTCVSNYDTKYYPGGQPAAVNPDLGDTQGYQGQLTEQNALVFALFSLIDPSPSARILHAQRARNILMLAMDEAVKGHLAGAPFRDPMFAVYNRANASSECWPLAIDWIYGATQADGVTPILTAADKRTIRDVFMIWADDCLHASTCGGDHPSPIGAMNTTALLPRGNAHRVAANNYYSGHARLLTLMSLSIDPADDPAVNPATPLPILGNSLRSYIPEATGAWLYQQFAMFGDPAAVKAAFNLPPTASVGLASGGLPPEGGLYGHSYSYLLGEMLALKTAGFADTTISGPQAALVTAPVWDRYLVGMANNIAPAAAIAPSQPWMGPVFQMANYGDTLRLWLTPDFMQVFALKNLLDQKNGDPANLEATRWFAINAVEGGAVALNQRIANPWTYGVQASVLYFLLLDPTLPAPADPRPAYADHFFDPGIGRLLSRTGWSPSASIFTFHSSWESINHQDGDAGQFELYRKGEWLTKELSNYDNNGNGQSSIWHNSLSLQNWCANGKPQNLNFFEAPYWPNGSQWNNGMNAGDPVTVASTGPGYAYAQTDMTQLYNRPSVWTPANAALDIQHASRSVIWLQPDHLVVYDRATSLHNGFKRFNLNFPAAPFINPVNRTATAATPGGQRLHVSSLLPANATLSYVPEGGTLSNIAQLETMKGRLVVEDLSMPADTRFLHLLQAADPATPADPAALAQSVAGTAFDGMAMLDTAVFFASDLKAASQGTTLLVPSAVVQVLVTGLTPGAGYGITTTGVTAGVQIQIIPGGQTATADAAGVLVLAL